MARLICIFSLFLAVNLAYSQCTITGTSPLNWSNPGPNCQGGGTASGQNVLIIPAGFTVIFDSNGDNWSGLGVNPRIEVYGTLSIEKDVTISSNIIVHDDGLLSLQSKLSIGSSASCGFGLSIKTGGTVDVGGTGSDRLSICGKEIMKGNGVCNDCGGTFSGKCAYNNNPYCEPSGGFQGPLGYDEGGYSLPLPIKLADFESYQLNDDVLLDWSTATEENFDKFIIEHSTDGQHFDSIGIIKGAGNSKLLLSYSFTHSNPVIGKNYYRLKQVDYDLSIEYSPVAIAIYKSNRQVVVYPNPSRGEQVKLRLNFHPEEDARVEVYSNLGVKLGQYPISQLANAIKLPGLQQGSYLLRVTSGSFSQVVRFSVI